MSETKVRTALESERNRVIATVTAGFITDPVARWVWPEPDSYMANCPRFVAAYGGKAFRHGSAWIDANRLGGALWLPPGETPDEKELGEVVTSSVEESKQADLFAALEQLGTYHPKEPHWFLPLIAVDPMWQGQGIGSALMRFAASKLDETGTRAYLESSNPRNISLYVRHGFKVIGEVRSGHCPVFTPMLREPR